MATCAALRRLSSFPGPEALTTTPSLLETEAKALLKERQKKDNHNLSEWENVPQATCHAALLHPAQPSLRGWGSPCSSLLTPQFFFFPPWPIDDSSFFPSPSKLNVAGDSTLTTGSRSWAPSSPSPVTRESGPGAPGPVEGGAGAPLPESHSRVGPP